MRLTAAQCITSARIKKLVTLKKILFMLTKEQIIESIKNMPEEKFEDIDVLLERIMLDKIFYGIFPT
jgi:hypothetical protein